MAVLAVSCLAAPAGIRTVYLLPMAGGLDQYLAAWLTSDHVLQVVADPQLADAVMTDSLGETFERRLAQIHPPEAADKTEVANKSDKLSDRTGSSAVPAFRSSRSKGTLFLVDAKTRTVLWSDYEKVPSTSSSGNLSREARRVVRKLAGGDTGTGNGTGKTEQ
jgi:hypothetical protein